MKRRIRSNRVSPGRLRSLGAEVQVDIRGKLLAARVVKLPFVRNGKILLAL
jgi:glycine cleavage system aminomethyltransferase T